MLDHSASTQQLMFLYLYLVYLYQFVKKNTHNLSIVYCVFLIISRKLFGFIAVLSRCIEQSDVIS